MREITIREFKKQNKKPLKYHNIIGIKQSRKEERYEKILEMQKKSLILKNKVIKYFTQVPFEFRSGIKYIADFVILYADMHWEIIDTKGVRTYPYQIKKKMLKEEYGLEIKEII